MKVSSFEDEILKRTNRPDLLFWYQLRRAIQEVKAVNCTLTSGKNWFWTADAADKIFECKLTT